MDNAYQSNGRHKWYLKCHLIFVCKYRKRLLEGTMQDIIKEIFSIIELHSSGSRTNSTTLSTSNRIRSLITTYERSRKYISH